MSLHRRNPRRDAVETAIVETMRWMGWSVQPLSGKGCPDLVAGIGHTIVLIEIKSPKGKLTKDQEAWHAAWNGPKPIILRSVDAAVTLTARLRKVDSA